VCAALLLAYSGCTQTQTSSTRRKGQSVEARKELPFVHKVRWEGETFSLIAKWYTGSYKNWKALAKNNPWLEPDNILPGHKVFIPRNLLKTQKAMPRDFVLSSVQKAKAKSVRTNKRSKKVEAELRETKAAELEFVIP
jgi:hypothetical protein